MNPFPDNAMTAEVLSIKRDLPTSLTTTPGTLTGKPAIKSRIDIISVAPCQVPGALVIVEKTTKAFLRGKWSRRRH